MFRFLFNTLSILALKLPSVMLTAILVFMVVLALKSATLLLAASISVALLLTLTSIATASTVSLPRIMPSWAPIGFLLAVFGAALWTAITINGPLSEGLQHSYHLM